MSDKPTEPIDISDSIAYRVHRLARLLRKHFLQIAADGGIELTPEQWFCLNKLRLRGPMSQTALTDNIFADKPNITRILARLEKRGLVHRARDPDDARRQRVSLTPEGAEIHDTFADIVASERAALFRDISDGEMQTAHRVLESLEDSLKS